ncbi:MAG: Type 1 glutamine amidotransferase-like domain-containing protein [Gammaproteobacteria bacterium]
MTLRAMLGPQRDAPYIAPLLEHFGLGGARACAVTAGWQEREGELDELEAHTASKAPDLTLYQRAEDVFARDPDFQQAYQRRQRRLREMQRLYRRRLAHAVAALREMELETRNSDLVLNERRSAMRALRTLDRQHLRRIRGLLEAFDARYEPLTRPAVAEHRAEIKAELDACQVLFLAGGHVEVLLNRLRLFGVAELLREQAVIAWSAGAMAISDQIVLFHDDPVQGSGIAEVADTGLGLIHGVLPLPHASNRLDLEDQARVALFCRRFLPARSMTLDPGAALIWQDGQLVLAQASSQMVRTGNLRPVAAI